MIPPLPLRVLTLSPAKASFGFLIYLLTARMQHSRSTMRIKLTNFCFALLCIWLCCAGVSAKPLHHYVFFGMDREKINDKLFLENEIFEGAQVAYSWNQLEPGKDE